MDDGDKYRSGNGNRYIDCHCFMLYYPDGGHMKPVEATEWSFHPMAMDTSPVSSI